MNPLVVWIVGSVAIIVVGCLFAEVYDRAARRYGWPR